jgi:TRAP-type uncharacterized transport system fused permease subunit
MFIFYYAVLSEVSPPTALAPFAAAAVTGGDPRATLTAAWKYTTPAFLVPIAFAIAPAGLGLLFQGTPWGIALTAVTALAGVVAVAASFGGRRRPSIGLLAAGLALLYPALLADLLGLALAGVTFFAGRTEKV